MVWWLIAGQALLGGMQQKQEQQRQNKAQRAFERKNTQFAHTDLLQTYSALAARRLQERRALGEGLQQMTMDARRRSSSARVSAGESGVSGNSTDALLDEFTAIQLRNEQSGYDTELAMQDQFVRDSASAQSNYKSRVFGGQQQRIGEPDYMGLFLNGVSQYMEYRMARNRINTVNGQPINNSTVPYSTTPGGGIKALQE